MFFLRPLLSVTVCLNAMKIINNRVFPINRQSGVVLVISLIMLLLLTIIGLTSSQVTSLEEKMVSNTKDLNLAFQAAEDALRGGEERIEAAVKLDDFAGTNGLLGEVDALLDFSASSSWSASNSTEFDLGIAEVGTQPRYIIKFMGERVTDTLNVGESSSRVAFFIVTSRGTGGLDSSQAYLRSYYGKRF